MGAKLPERQSEHFEEEEDAYAPAAQADADVRPVKGQYQPPGHTLQETVPGFS